MRILLLGDAESIFNKQLIYNLKKIDNSIQADIISRSPVTSDKNNYDHVYTPILLKNRGVISAKLNIYISHIFVMLHLLFMQKYDVINIMYMSNFWKHHLNSLLKKSNKLIVTFYGSDFYRASESNKIKYIQILDKSKYIITTNSKMKDAICEYYNDYHDKAIVSSFGLESLEHIDAAAKNPEHEQKIKDYKEKLKIPYNKIVITCGQSASVHIGHEKIISQIRKLNKDTQDNIFLIFPMTYGDKEHRESIKKILKEGNDNYLVLEDYMSVQDIALLRLISDIYINVQPTDQLSGTMQEHLYSGSVVINGSWLPYDIFKENNCFFMEVDSTEQLSNTVQDVINDIAGLKQKCNGNNASIKKLTSWSSCSKRWYDIYRGNI